MSKFLDKIGLEHYEASIKTRLASKQSTISDLSTIRENATNAIKQGGTLTAPLTVTGGDDASAGKIILDDSHQGQITNSSTSTLFGFNDSSNLIVGSSSYTLKLRGSGSRPKFNDNDLALKSDVDNVLGDIEEALQAIRGV